MKKSWVRCVSFLLYLSVVISLPVAAEEATYIVLSASSDSNARQPVRIGLTFKSSVLRRTAPMRHIDADALISEFPPGSHAIDHIDFDDKLDSESEKHYARDTQWLQLQEGKINFVGSLVFKRAGWKKLEVTTGNNDELLEAACQRNPEAFAKHPVVLVGTDTEFNYRCDGSPAEK